VHLSPESINCFIRAAQRFDQCRGFAWLAPRPCGSKNTHGVYAIPNLAGKVKSGPMQTGGPL